MALLQAAASHFVLLARANLFQDLIAARLSQGFGDLCELLICKFNCLTAHTNSVPRKNDAVQKPPFTAVFQHLDGYLNMILRKHCVRNPHFEVFLPKGTRVCSVFLCRVTARFYRANSKKEWRKIVASLCARMHSGLN